MTQVAAALLVLPDGKVVLQRRTKDARISPGKLGFFGGHVELGETVAVAVKREIGEETSLEVRRLNFEHIAVFSLSAKVTGNEDVEFHVFRVEIPNSDFAVYEGDRLEIYGINEALARNDITASTRHVLTSIKEN